MGAGNGGDVSLVWCRASFCSQDCALFFRVHFSFSWSVYDFLSVYLSSLTVNELECSISGLGSRRPTSIKDFPTILVRQVGKVTTPWEKITSQPRGMQSHI